MTGSRVDRRVLLGGAAALSGLGALSACTSGTPAATPRRGTTTAPGEDPDVTLAATVLGEQRAALALLEATVRRHPGLSTVLAGALAGHRRHVRLLAGAVPSADPSASASAGSSSGGGTGGTLRVPAGAAAALAALAGSEGALAASGRRHALAARSGAFARVLASVAAAATQQQVRLTDAARSRS